MANQVMIIGLGRFGMALARTLSEKGAEVLAVDSDRELVEEAAAFCTEAIAIDATDEVELARLNPGSRDAVVCAIGDDSKEASIMCTALLRQMGVPLIITRAGDKMHRRILQQVGAHMVINPEQEFGKRFANRILYRDVVAENNFAGDFQLTEIFIQPSMVGKTLVQLELPKRFGILVAAIRRGTPPQILQPSPHEPLQENDQLLVVSREDAIEKLARGV